MLHCCSEYQRAEACSRSVDCSRGRTKGTKHVFIFPVSYLVNLIGPALHHPGAHKTLHFSDLNFPLNPCLFLCLLHTDHFWKSLDSSFLGDCLAPSQPSCLYRHMESCRTVPISALDGLGGRLSHFVAPNRRSERNECDYLFLNYIYSIHAGDITTPRCGPNRAMPTFSNIT